MFFRSLRCCIICALVFPLALSAQSSHSTLTQQAQEYLNSLAAYERFSGVTIVAQGEDILYEGAFGWANHAENKEMSPDKVLGLGSLTKQFTAAAIMKLASEGVLSVEDPLSQWLPDWSPVASELTLHHLLTHTSGLNQDIGRADRFEDIIFPSEEAISLEALLERFSAVKIDGKPGNNYDYNNLNYILLAGVVERASGMDYTTYLETVLGAEQVPLYGDVSTISPGLQTEQYMGLPREWAIQPRWHMGWMIGAGNVATTARGMQAWLSRLQDTTFLPSTYLDKMLKGYASISGGRRYAYGWEVSQKEGVKRVEHDGAVNGYVAQVVWLPETDLRVIVMTNHTHDLDEISTTTRHVKEIANVLLGLAQEEPATPLPLRAKAVIGFESGTYTLPQGRRFTLTASATSIATQTEGDSAWSLLDLPYLDQYTVEGRQGRKLARIVAGFGHQDYRKILRECRPMIRVLLNPEKIGGFWSGMVEDAGAYQGYRVYSIPEPDEQVIYKVALLYEHAVVGLRLYWKGGKIQGMFIDQEFTARGPKAVVAIPVGTGVAFVDGFRLGYADGLLEQVNENTLKLTVQGQTYLAQRVVR